VLVIDHGDRWTVHARRLFRDRARFVMAIYDDGRIIVRDAPRAATREITVRSRHGVTVVGDYVRFADPRARTSRGSRSRGSAPRTAESSRAGSASSSTASTATSRRGHLG